MDVRPFRGLRYRPSAVGDLSLVISPPYDVVGVDQRGRLYEQSPYNIVRLEFGLPFPDDGPGDNVYTRAAALFRRWRAEGVLGEEASPAFYVLEEVFTHQGGRRVRRGVLGAVRLEPYGGGVVFPHEHTAPGPKEDRLRLWQATGASFSPILALCPPSKALRDILQALAETPPQVDTQGWDATRYRMWVVTGPEEQRAIRAALAPLPVYLADGHHRYEAALLYRSLREKAGPSHPDAVHNFAPMCLVGMDDPGLVVEAFHRLVPPLPPQGRLALEAQEAGVFTPLEGSWPLTPAHAEALLERIRGERGVLIGLAKREEGRLRLLRLRPGALAGRAPHPALLGCPSWVVQEGVLVPALGEEALSHTVAYVHSLSDVLHRLERGEAERAYLLPPIPWGVFTAVVEAGLRLPPKSTYFYPKLPAGLVIYPLEGTVAPP
jgi:uncharacterized protein (DUF1015 family)